MGECPTLQVPRHKWGHAAALASTNTTEETLYLRDCSIEADDIRSHNVWGQMITQMVVPQADNTHLCVHSDNIYTNMSALIHRAP